MREEDEIRAAVVALMEAQEAGEDVSDQLPDAEAMAEALEEITADEGGDVSEEADPKAAREQAIACVLDYVRAVTRASRLAVPSEWAEAGLVPPSMVPEDLEMAVYDALLEYGDPYGSHDAGEASASKAGAAASRRPTNRHIRSAFSSSNGRPVGAMGFKAHKAVAPEDHAEVDSAKEDIAGKDPAGNDDAREGMVGKDPVGGDQGRPSSSEVDLAREGRPRSAPTEEIPDSTEASEPMEDSDSTGVAEASGALPLVGACAGIRMLMGAESYYLYDSAVMTDAYARWAFLAAEDDSVATFTECVREESSVYPRPMARESLANEPFRMNAEAVEAAFAAARDQGRADDVERVEASNGDVYFYSTTYLSPRRAQALAEWDAVERIRNV